MADDVRVPRKHDRVTTMLHNGVFTVVDVDEKSQTAVLQTVTGDGPLMEGVPWTTLQFMGEEDDAPPAASAPGDTTKNP
jgi:hypothetical protein